MTTKVESSENSLAAIPYVSNISSIYQKGNVKLINADCMEIMKQYPDKYFDLAVVDPPYGIGIAEWDDIKDRPTEIYFNELFRISKNQIIWGGKIGRAHV